MSAHHEQPALDRKARARLEDQRRMAYRRAIEQRVEMRRIELELDASFGQPGSACFSPWLASLR